MSVDSRDASHRITSLCWMIARKELIDTLRDFRWTLLLAFSTVLILGAVVMGRLQWQRLAQAREVASVEDHRAWNAQGAKNPHSAAHFGQVAFRPITYLGVVEPGVTDYVGNSIFMEAHKQNEDQLRSARDAPLSSRLPQFSMGFLFLTVVPLLILLLSWDGVSREREQGTLQQLIAMGVAPIHLILGKAMAGFILVVGLLAFGLLFFLGFLQWSHASDGLLTGAEMASTLPRMAGLFVSYGLYFFGFFGLSFAVSCWSRSSRTALVLLMGFWCLNCLVVPRTVTEVVARVDPLPTSHAFRTAMDEDRRKRFGSDETHPAFRAFRDRVLAQYAVERVEDLPVSFRGLTLRENDESGYRVFDQHFGELHSKVERQDRWRTYAGVLFPVLAVQASAMAFSGTDNRHHHDFVRSAENHRRKIQTEASQHLIDHAKNGDLAYVAPASTWAHFPSFAYKSPDAAWALKGAWLPLSLLFVWSSCCSLLALVAAQRLRGMP